jgi:hypothetical protein
MAIDLAIDLARSGQIWRANEAAAPDRGAARVAGETGARVRTLVRSCGAGGLCAEQVDRAQPTGHAIDQMTG